MHRDLHGLPISAASNEAAAAFDAALIAYMKYRLDTPDRLAALLKLDPQFALGHCLRGYLTMLSYKQANVQVAAEAAATARSLMHRAIPREQAHVAALDAWIAGQIDRAIDLWEAILAQHPHDVLAFRLAHFSNFWLGRPQAMRISVDRVYDQWQPGMPGYGTILSCRCFAYEECGDYAAAEPAGRAAVEIDAEDLWGTHAVAHVMEMQGRHDEGIEWLRRLEPNWRNASNLKHHLWWHRAMFHLERREFDAVLELYDSGFRNLGSPLTRAQPDVYIDVQNAASMLFRLQRQGVDVGQRWAELADRAEARIGDCLSAFTLPHWAMALAATGRDQAAQRLLDGMRAAANGSGTVAPIVGRVALPVSQAVVFYFRGEYQRAVEVMKPALDDMHQLGGSHAQQDVLMQLFLDAAVKSDRSQDARMLLARAARRFPVPPERRIGYAAAAQSLQ